MSGQAKKLVVVGIAAAFVACVDVSGIFAEAETSTTYDYDSLVRQAEVRDAELDFTGLRLGYAHSAAFDPYNFEDEGFDTLMWRAYHEERYEEALEWAAKILDKNYVDIDAHIIGGISCNELGDSLGSARHFWVADGLIGSILAGGDGQSRESAYIVIDVSEEYALFRVMGWEGQQQSLMDTESPTCDHWEVFDPEADSTLEVWFNVEIPMNYLSRKLEDH